MKNFFRCLVLVLLLNPATVLAADQPFLSPAFGDHMVLQREKPNTFWGWTHPGSEITVSVGTQQAKGIAGPDGKWTASLTSPKVGGPYTVTIDGPAHVELTDVMVGDVWLCTGQSNMEFGIGVEKGGADAIAHAADSGLRLFMAPRQVALSPAKTNGGQWVVCTPQSVVKGGWAGFSAVGYNFGHALRREIGVPIGLVQINWGGTTAETWTSVETLTPLGDFAPGLAVVDSLRKEGSPPFGDYLDLWLYRHDPGSRPGADWQRPDLDDHDWTGVSVPNGFTGVGITDQDAVVWFRKSFDLPDPLPAGDAKLSLGPIFKTDQTWLNGEPVGNGSWGPSPRNYGLPSQILKSGKNLIAVRVVSNGQKRGFEGPADLMFIELANGTRIPISEGLKAKIGAKIGPDDPGPASYDTYPNLPTVLFNGMIAPEAPLAIRGVIWYQGEANTSHAYQYRTLLPAMIGDWRRTFAQGDFPFYIVSLAAYEKHKETPGDDEWAELREAQALTARTVPNCGLALAIDIGDENNIHPTDKKTVGERLALVALAKTYGKDVIYSGPVYRSMERQRSTIRLTFDHTEGHLKCSGEKLAEFSVAGADRQWHWADAKIEDDTVVVSSPDVPEPVAARYAWQAYPIATLINGAGLPAVPFRTDDWREITAGRK